MTTSLSKMLRRLRNESDWRTTRWTVLLGEIWNSKTPTINICIFAGWTGPPTSINKLNTTLFSLLKLIRKKRISHSWSFPYFKLHYGC